MSLGQELFDRAKMLAREKAARRHDAGDAAAYDPVTGMLKDGHSIRISMTDAKPLPLQSVVPSRRSEPLVIKTGLTGQFALDKFLYPTGEPKPPREARARPVQKTADAASAALDAAMNDQFASHKPGYRFADATDGTTTDARVESYNFRPPDIA